MTKYRLAVRLADNVHTVESHNYAIAVSRCIRFKFDAVSCDFSDKEFQEQFFEGVVVPLRADWEFAAGKF